MVRASVTARESHECPEDVVEAVSKRGLDFGKVAKRRTHLEARENLAQRTECCVVTRCSVSTP